jgi:BirA family biotin operon repressor/biotin-[acetyl-CoA-carboxylase] ligase
LIGKVQLRFNSIDSTNKYAIELLSKTRPTEGTAIIADYQTEGRGQVGSIWQSNSYDNILMSIILYPKTLEVNNQYLVSCIVSLAIKNVLSRILADQEIKIKWPNDILCEGRKIAGILIHNTLKGKKVKSSVIGMGINVNQKSFPLDVPNATSLLLERGHTFQIEETRTLIFEELDKRYRNIIGNIEIVRQEYLSHLYGLGIEKKFKRANGSIFSGRIAGIDAQGFLIIDGPNGKEKFDVKQVIYEV